MDNSERWITASDGWRRVRRRWSVGGKGVKILYARPYLPAFAFLLALCAQARTGLGLNRNVSRIPFLVADGQYRQT